MQAKGRQSKSELEKSQAGLGHKTGMQARELSVDPERRVDRQRDFESWLADRQFVKNNDEKRSSWLTKPKISFFFPFGFLESDFLSRCDSRLAALSVGTVSCQVAR